MNFFPFCAHVDVMAAPQLLTISTFLIDSFRRYPCARVCVPPLYHIPLPGADSPCIPSCSDFFVSYLSDPVAVWEAELARRVAADPTYAPPFVPPLTTEDMQLYFRASMHRGQWSILRPYERVRGVRACVTFSCLLSVSRVCACVPSTVEARRRNV